MDTNSTPSSVPPLDQTILSSSATEKLIASLISEKKLVVTDNQLIYEGRPISPEAGQPPQELMDTSTPLSSLGSFRTPRKTTKMGLLVKPPSPPNRFQPLESESQADIEHKARNATPNSATPSVTNPFSQINRKSGEISPAATGTESIAAANQPTSPGTNRVPAGSSGRRSSQTPGPSAAGRQTQSRAASAKKTTDRERNEYCPPIVIRGKPPNHKALTDELNSFIRKGYYIKYARNSFLIFIKDKTEYEVYKNSLVNSPHPVEFHTYSLPTEKTHAFVLQGLYGDPEIDLIKQEIEKDENIGSIKIFKMRTKFTPMYLVVVNQRITLTYLRKNIQYLLNIKVNWERRLSDNPITQCRKCQAWGHTTTNCHRRPKCLICARDHLTRDCTHPKDSPPQCANFGQDHLANNKVCPMYLYHLERLQKNQKEPEFVPAPLPPPESTPGRNHPQSTTRTAAPTQPNTRAPGAVQVADQDFPPL